ncbi:MAG TPA: DUF5916 domain-containing protein [Gemmatimonadales bacterium]|nr:DUF5916 domain-containing protein [Gemmatimonadales bacterium]
MPPRALRVPYSCWMLAAVLAGGPLAAQAPDPGAGKVARAVRLSGPAPAIDGRLDDSVWTTAAWFRDFAQKVPVEGGVPEDTTEVAFLYDDDALYVGARLQSARVAEIPRPMTRRDQYSNAEYFIVALDPYRDRRTGYSFSVSSGGVQGDSYHPADEEDFRDPAYNPVWQVRISFDSTAWYVEMRIPFSQIRFNKQAVQEWGLNVNRWRPGFNEDIYWVVIPRAQTGFFSHFGALEGMNDIQPQRTAEVIPYLAASADFVGAPGEGNPFTEGTQTGIRVGADFKLGLGPNLTLDATVNPDFGQVEADPAEVNLTAFETFFPEQRPFFIEGNQLLQGNGPGYYYSRRIGGQPRGTPTGGTVDDANFVDIPGYATILGAAKLTGRTSSGMSVGALAALTQREYATTYNVDSNAYDKVAVEPLTAYAVGRLQQEIGSSASTIGVTLTGLSRSFADAAPLELQLAGQAFTGGADWLARLSGGTYQVGGYAGFSYVHGSTQAITDVQTSSAHYFQRPDQTYAPLDTLRTSLAGYTLGLSAVKASGRHWTGGVEGSLESPGFELNDAGRLSSADDVDAEAYVNYRENVPGRVFRFYRIGLATATGWNFGGTRTYSVLRLNTNYQWRNWWNTYVGAWFNPRSTSDDLTRGGPLMGTGQQVGVQAELFTNEANAYRVGGNITLSKSEFGGSSQSYGLNLIGRPGDRWQFSARPQLRHVVNPRQYVASVAGGYADTYGTRYVFATVDQSTLSMQLRLNYSFTPQLTLELYAEPFASSGDYADYGELSAAGASSLVQYGTNNTTIVQDPDGNYTVTDGNNGQVFQLTNNNFNVLSYRSNLVLRWEWRPGSALFFIWQQNRNSFCSGGYDSGICYQTDDVPGSGLQPGDLLQTVKAPGDNQLVVKATYWLSIH